MFAVTYVAIWWVYDTRIKTFNFRDFLTQLTKNMLQITSNFEPSSDDLRITLKPFLAILYMHT